MLNSPSFPAACSIENEDHTTAIEWLDRGRLILWEHFAQLCAPHQLVGNADAERLRTLQVELLHERVLINDDDQRQKLRRRATQ